MLHSWRWHAMVPKRLPLHLAVPLRMMTMPRNGTSIVCTGCFVGVDLRGHMLGWKAQCRALDLIQHSSTSPIPSTLSTPQQTFLLPGVHALLWAMWLVLNSVPSGNTSLVWNQCWPGTKYYRHALWQICNIQRWCRAWFDNSSRISPQYTMRHSSLHCAELHLSILHCWNLLQKESRGNIQRNLVMITSSWN